MAAGSAGDPEREAEVSSSDYTTPLYTCNGVTTYAELL